MRTEAGAGARSTSHWWGNTKCPLTSRVATLGPEAQRGHPALEYFDILGIRPEAGGKIIAGGPMSGTAAAGPDLPVTKEVAGITVQGPREVVAPVEAVCIKCGLCVDTCPMGLMPFLLSGFSEKGMLAQARAYDLFACIECGCCAYQCPVRIPMVHFIRFAKQRLSDRGGRS
jgi:electron transport complex protein RnfC